MSKKQDFEFGAGETFLVDFLWDTEEWESVPITAVSSEAPTVITAPGNSVIDGRDVAVVASQRIAGLTASSYPPRGDDLHRATVLTTSTIQLNAVSAVSATYAGGGFLVYSTPVDLLTITEATFTIYDAPDDGTVLLALTSSPAAGVTLNNTTKKITVLFQTEGLAWEVGYYTLNAENADGAIIQLASGMILIP